MGVRVTIVSEDQSEKSMILGLRLEIDKDELITDSSLAGRLGRHFMSAVSDALLSWSMKRKK